MNSFLLVLACVATQPVQAAPPASKPAEATYTFRLLDGAPSRVQVELCVRGDDDGESAFSVPPDWAGVDRCADFLHELAFLDGDGKPLASTHPNDLGWNVTHAPGAAITARWFLESPSTPLGRTGNDYRPHVAPGLFQVVGGIGMLRPDSLAGAQKHAFRVAWRGFAEKGFKVASSYGDDPDGATVNETLDTFLHAVFLAGELRLCAREVRGGRLLFALAGSGYAFQDEQLVDIGTRIVKAEREFFSDFSDPLFVITLVPVETSNAGSTSLGGTGLTHSFALFLSRNVGLGSKDADAPRLKHVLAHEYFHRWNGGAIRLEEPEGLGYWFSEGFTNFFARRILFRAGLFDAREYADNLNDALKEYWLNPFRNAPDSRIPQEFWKTKEIGDLPYRRGDLVALLLDHEIRAVSKGAQSLDDFMRDVVARAHDRDEVCSTDNLLELAADYTSQEFAERLRAIVVDGADVELDDDVLVPAFELATRKATRPGSTTKVEVPCFTARPDVARELLLRTL